MTFFLDFAAGASTLLAAGATSFSTVYGAIEGSKLAARQQKLQEQMAQSRMSLDEDLVNSQRNIFLVQEEGIRRSQDLDLRVKEARTELEIKKIRDEINTRPSPAKQGSMQNIVLVATGIFVVGVFISFFRRK